MAKKKIEEKAEAIRKIAADNKAVFGSNQTMTLLKKGSLAQIYVAKNCQIEELTHYASLAGTEIITTPYHNDELGILCKRHHAVSMLGVKK